VPEVTPIRDLKGYLEPEQVEQLMTAATNPRDRVMVRILWRSGIRVSELIGLRVGDIDFANCAIIIKVQKLRRKSGKLIERRRVVPIDKGTLDMIKEYLVWRKKYL
jgi:integrase